jgi:peptidoglycan/xylan/chitin deacetylase (PgdA/CDA1 family)
MDLPYHDRYDYSPIVERPDYSWPDGKRLAFYIGLNVEHFAFGQGGMGHTTTELGPPPDVRNYAWRDYGLRVGVWRLFDMFDELGLPVCHLLNSTVYDYAPQILERIRARGDEIIGHGRTNTERQADYPEKEEAALIREATEAITRNEGTPPRGWMGPWISHSPTTPDLLKEAGYDFLMDWPCDDQPFWMRTRSGPLLSVPYPIEINDSPAHLNRRHTAVEFCEMLTEQFDEMLTQSETHPLVMGLPLHTFIVGQPYRLSQLRKALTYIVKHPKADKVWFTRPNAIAEHVMALPPGTVPGSDAP